jgi:purine-nucleoside phosphorylase
MSENTTAEPPNFMTNATTVDQYTRARAAADHIRSHASHLSPVLGIILGSGLGNFAAHVTNPIAIPYAGIPHFPLSTVVGHAGQLVLGTIAGIPVAVLQGRVHAYEGYPLAEIVFPTRVLALLGCRSLIVTNAAGGIDPTYPAGSLVLIADHINLTGTNAAIGPNEPRFATRPGTAERFFDMSTAYSVTLRTLAQAEAAKQGVPLPEGIYLAVLGPSFETPAEIRAFRTLGATLVGMSTVHEVIVARHMGLPVLGLSLVTNLAAGITTQANSTPELIDHNEVLAIGRRAEARFTALLLALIPQIAAVS